MKLVRIFFRNIKNKLGLKLSSKKMVGRGEPSIKKESFDELNDSQFDS